MSVAGNACDTDYVNLRARNILHHLSQIRAKFRYYREGIEEIINLQPLKDGKAKAYQVKQVRGTIFKCKLHKGVENA